MGKEWAQAPNPLLADLHLPVFPWSCGPDPALEPAQAQHAMHPQTYKPKIGPHFPFFYFQMFL